MKKLLSTIYTFWLLSPIAAYGITPAQVGENACNATKDASGTPTAVGCDGRNLISDLFPNAIDVVIGVTAAVSVLMIVIGGLRYVLSGGDSAGIRSAKDTIIYAIVGLVISMLAFVIVRFVIGGIK